MLYLVATPIGNLKDFSFRAVETLNKVEYILCEDTRTSLTLLNHYEIKKIMQQSSDSGTFLFCIVPDTGTGC